MRRPETLRIESRQYLSRFGHAGEVSVDVDDVDKLWGASQVEITAEVRGQAHDPKCSLQLFDLFLLLGIGLRGCACPPKRSLGSRFHFVFPSVIEMGSDLILAARLCHVAALQTFQHNLPFSSGLLWTLGFLDILASWRRRQA
jgi:hypothetical protein